MATAESVKAKIQNLIATANETTGNADTDLTTAVNALIAGFGQGGSDGAFEVTEGTITPITASQTLRIPWGKETLPLFYLCIRQDFDTYVTPDNLATNATLGGIVNLCGGYIRASGSVTQKYINIRITATKDYSGYIAGQSDFKAEILDSDGLLAYCNSSTYKWSADTTYKYYIIDKAVA